MPRPTFTLTFPAFPGHLCRPVSDLTPEENRALMAEVSSVYRAIMAALDAHTEAYPETRQLAYIMAAHAVKLALEGEEADDPESDDDDTATLTEEELAEVNKVYEPLTGTINQYIDDSPTYPYDAIMEALARATHYYEGMQAYIDAEIDKDIAAEEADA